MRSPEGQDMPLRGVYLEVVKNERIVFTDAYTRPWEPADKPLFTGTVTFEVGKAVQEIRKGRVEFKVEKSGIVHVPVGKVSFEPTKLYDNASAIIESVMKAKPASCKGRYLKSATISSTMGPGVKLDAIALAKQWS